MATGVSVAVLEMDPETKGAPLGEMAMKTQRRSDQAMSPTFTVAEVYRRKVRGHWQEDEGSTAGREY